MDNTRDVKPRLADVKARLSSKEFPCIFCKKLWENRLTVINDKRDIVGALHALGVKYESIPGVMDHACYKCVYRINVIIDFRRLLERNINKSRANYYYSMGNRDMCRKYLLCNDANISNTANSTSSDNLNLLITDVRSEREPERTADFLFDCFNDPDMYTMHYAQDNAELLNSPSRLLEPMFETEFAESAGTNRSGSKYKNYNNLNDNKYNYKCQFCTKTYKRVYYLKKHERRHRAKMIRKGPTRASMINVSYECDRCHDVFDTRAHLKNHEKSHRNRMKCTYCTAEFYLYHDLELHEAKCFGEFSARDETASISTHYTRSQKRMRLRAESEVGSVDTEDNLYTVRMKNVNQWVDNVDPVYNSDRETEVTRHDDDDRMSVSSRNSSNASTFSRTATTVSERTSYMETDNSSVISAQVHERVTYEKPKLNSKLLSTKSSVYGGLKRTRAGAHRAEQLKRLDDFLCSNQTENQFSTPNWQRIRNQARRKNKAKRNIAGNSKPTYYCQYTKCYFFSNSLLDIMDHDITMHQQLPLYRCSECQLRFTRPNYLQCHAMDHAAKHHPCNMCNESFDYSHQLKYHLELHAIRSHKCPYCPRSFLKETELDNHLRENSHNMASIDIVHYKLFEDDTRAANDATRRQLAMTEQQGADANAYSVHYRPQVSDAGNKQKYERVRWSLASELTYYAGINQLTIDIDSMINGPATRNDADISFNEDSSQQVTLPVEQNTSTPAATEQQEDISENMNEDQLPATTAGDLERYQLFSVDSLDMNEQEEEKEANVDDPDAEDNATLIKKRKRPKNSVQLPSCLKRTVSDPALPSYSSIFGTQPERRRTRILPLMDCSLPSRFPL